MGVGTTSFWIWLMQKPEELSKEQRKGFPVHVEGSVNLSVVLFPCELFAVLN